jgi:hypothetical protein
MDVARAGVNPPNPHGLGSTAAPAHQSIVGGSPSYAADPRQLILISSQIGNDSGNEMKVGAQNAGLSGTNPNNHTGLQFPDELTEDGLGPPGLGSNTAVNVAFGLANLAFFGSYTRHARMLGTRYGAVEGQETGIANGGPIWGTISFSAQYDVLVSPVSVPGTFVNEYIIVGTSRLLADQAPCYKSVLEISTSSSGC